MERLKGLVRKAEWKFPDEVATGTPQKWNDTMPDAVYMLALLGATEQQMAEAFGVSISTITVWKNTHPEFNEKMREGGLIALGKVADALFKRAIGYEVEEDHVTVFRGEVTVTRMKRHIPADSWAAARILALKHRQLWSESQRIDITTTNTNINIDLKDISYKDMEVLEKIAWKELPKHDGSD